VFANTDITKRKRAEQLLQALNVASLAMQRAVTPKRCSPQRERGSRSWVSLARFSSPTRARAGYSPSISATTKKRSSSQKGYWVSMLRPFPCPSKQQTCGKESTWEGKTIFVSGIEGTRQVMPKPLKKFASQIAKVLEIPRSVIAPLILDDKAIGLLSVQSDDLTEDDNAGHHRLCPPDGGSLAQSPVDARRGDKPGGAEAYASSAFAVTKDGSDRTAAGGVAHDFNNMLTIVHLSTQLLKRQLRPEDPLREYVQQIEEAGERRYRPDQQLLSFSRRDVIEPHVVDLNQEIGNLSRMLQRIIGEDIEFVTALADDLWPVYLDPAQIDQVIVNLAVNARDAMPNGGRLTIETANIVLDEASAAHYVGLEPGDYVNLTVRDTGVGMGDEVQAHILSHSSRPKKRDHGTGLGLSTVFGIIKAKCRTHLGRQSSGTRRNLPDLLARTTRLSLRLHCAVTPVRRTPGSETILVVEDYAGVRGLATQILKAHGYQVLAAKNGPEAIQIKPEARPSHPLVADGHGSCPG